MGESITAGKDYKESRKRVQKPMRLPGMMRPWQLEQLTFKFREDLLSLCPKSERDTMCHTYHRSRGASIACVDELLKEITSGSRLSKRTKSFRSLRLILPSED